MHKSRFFVGALAVVAIASCDVSSPTAPAIDPQLSKAPAAQGPGASASRRGWYVATTGNDANPGTAAQPFLTIQKAVNSAGGSDSVIVQAGTYSITSGIMITKKGANGAPFILRGIGKPVIQDATGSSLFWKGLLNVTSSSFVTINGFALRNSGFFGVMIDRSSRIAVMQSSSTTSAGSAVYASNSTNVTIAQNDFSDFCKLGNNGRGMPCQEGISLASVDTFDVASNLVHDAYQNGSQVQPGGGEGIDAKEASRNGKIRFNKVYNLVQLGIYVDAWNQTAEDIEIYGNRVWNAASGIVIASEMGGTVRNIRVHDNLVYRNGDDGIRVSSYGANGLRDNIAIYNNTTAFNGYTANKPPYCVLWGCANYGTGLRLETTNIVNSRVHDNISYNNATTVMESNASAANVVIDTNLLFPVGKSPWAPEKLGLRPIKLDPKFVAPGTDDYHLLVSSPAIRKTLGGDVLNVDADKIARTVIPSDLGALLYR